MTITRIRTRGRWSQASSEEIELSRRDGHWIEVRETEHGIFEIVGNSYTDEGCHRPCLGFEKWDDDVIQMDKDNEIWVWCNASTHLRWGKVDITPQRIKAPDLDTVREALKRVVLCAYDPMEV